MPTAVEGDDDADLDERPNCVDTDDDPDYLDVPDPDPVDPDPEEPTKGCGCTTGGTSAGFLIGVLALVWRRRATRR